MQYVPGNDRRTPWQGSGSMRRRWREVLGLYILLEGRRSRYRQERHFPEEQGPRCKRGSVASNACMTFSGPLPNSEVPRRLPLLSSVGRVVAAEGALMSAQAGTC